MAHEPRICSLFCSKMNDFTFSITSLPTLAAMFLIVMCRVSAVVMVSPGLGETTSPMMIRAGIALCMSVTILPVVQPYVLPITKAALNSPAQTLGIIAIELLCGIFLGWLARLVALSFAIAMQMIAVFTGLASVLQPDTELGASSTALSHMATMLIPVIFLSTGLYILPLTAVTGSYNLFPPGHMPMIGDMAKSITQTSSHVFMLALQLSAPFVLIGTLWPAMLGVLNRLLPSIQVYSIAMPAQILGGVLLLAILIQVLTGVWQERSQDMLLNMPGINRLHTHP
ncbi:flagellar biosynthetic protein FliR [Acetobacter orientalis]|uniref:flagellar biosynthetic protein FliR n=1 Tax=Acetobacter orientalis TaxID=146474 RepID=UPI0039E785C7